MAKSDNGRIVIGSVVLAVVSGGLGYAAGAMGGEAKAGDRVVLEPTSRGAPPTTEMADLEATIEEQQRQIAALEEALDARRVEVADAPESPPVEADVPPEEPALSSEPMILPEQYAEILKDIDWAKVGDSMHKMTPLLKELAAALAAGKEPDLAQFGRLQELNGGLVTMARQASEAGIPGFGPNGTFTHPAVAGNQVAAVLAAAELPLTPAQRDRVQAMVELYSREDANLRLAEGTHEMALQSVLEECTYKDRFYQELDGILTPEQLATIRPDGPSRGTTSFDLFSSGLVWQQVARPVTARNRAELVETGTLSMMKTMKLSPEQRAGVQAQVESWADGLPGDYWTNPEYATPSSMMTKQQVAAAARRQMQLIQSLAASGVLTPQQVAQLKQNPGVMVPVVSPQ